MIRPIVLASLLCALPWTPMSAQYQPAPSRYTIVIVGDGQTQHFYRDGDRVLHDLEIPKSDQQTVAIHLRTIVDAPTTKQLSWDLRDASVPCNSVGTGDWGDPFDLWNQMALDDSVPPQRTGTDTVNGLATTTFEKTISAGSLEFWRENTYGLLVKAVITPTGRGPLELFETKEFKVGAPDPSVFKVPARCHWTK